MMTWIDWLMVALPILFIGGVALFIQQYVKGVADFMAGGRCAGRYLLANARGEMGMAIVGSVAAFEVFYQAGFSMGFWEFIRMPVGMFIASLGFEGLLSMILFVVVIIVILLTFSWQEVHEVLAMAPAGKSMLDPFDAGKVEDFNFWYVLIGVLGAIYNTMAWQGGHAFNSSAASAHEAKMAGIISSWRGYGKLLFISLLSIAAYTYLKHPDFASGAEQVRQILSTVDNPQIVKQMRMPVALGLLLPIGIKGIVCALFLMGLIACDGSYLHSWGSILIQDVVVPLRKTPLSPGNHLRLLRTAIVGVALFGFFFSLFFNQTEYILMFFAITGAIYLGGAGAVIIGGLYWKRGTAAAAWTAMLVGAVLAPVGMLLQQPAIWKQVTALMLNWGDISLPGKLPINGQWIFLITMIASAGSYVLVSLFTCKECFNMDRMLHRGIYAPEESLGVARTPTAERKFRWGILIGINRDFTTGDKVISVSVFGWKMLWIAAGVFILIWNIFERWPITWWSNYWYIKIIFVPIIVTAITTVWFTWGGIRDLVMLVKRLEILKRNEKDDGTVVGHHNLDEETGNGNEVRK